MQAVDNSPSTSPKKQPRLKCQPVGGFSPTILKAQRLAVKFSQAELARQSGVHRVTVCLFEKGDVTFTSDQQRRIRQAIQREAVRLRNIAISFDPEPAATAEVPAGA